MSSHLSVCDHKRQYDKQWYHGMRESTFSTQVCMYSTESHMHHMMSCQSVHTTVEEKKQQTNSRLTFTTRKSSRQSQSQLQSQSQSQFQSQSQSQTVSKPTNGQLMENQPSIDYS